jgi:predicted enzyme related to lactoylglutathione lyase
MKFAGTCVYVDDVAAVLDFYRRAFGFETRYFDEAVQYGELDTGATVLSFASHQFAAALMPGAYVRPANGQSAGVEVGFLVADVPAAFARAVSAGAVGLAEPKEMPWGQTVAYLRSIEGTLIGLNTPMVLDILEERLGPPPAALAAAVRACKEPLRHREMLGVATRAASFEEFRRDAGL